MKIHTYLSVYNYFRPFKAASIVANALSTNAFEAMKENIEHNGVDDIGSPTPARKLGGCVQELSHIIGLGGGGGDCRSVGLFHPTLGIDIT